MLFDKTRHAGFLNVGAFSRSVLGFAAASMPAVISAQVATQMTETWSTVSEPEDHFLNYNSTIPDECFEAIFRERESV